MKSPTIAIYTWKEGHLSIAQAIHESIENSFDSKLIQVKLNSASTIYMPFYRMFPGLFKVPFKLGEFESAQKIVRAYINQSKANKVVWKSLANHKPNLVISTWSPINFLLEEYHRDSNTPFINILTDPRTLSSFIPSKQAINLAFDNHQIKTCKKLGIPKNKLIKSGWFVRNDFEEQYSKNKVRKQLNIPKEDLTFLVCGGSDGTNAVLKIIPALMLQKNKLNIYFVCGTNKALYQTVKAFARIAKTTNKNLNLIPLSFTKELHKYMQAADLVIGKAGPNLLFESVATLTPFFAITHISGQEDGNLDIINQDQLGYVEENPISATKLIQNIINNPNQLKIFDKHLKKMRSYNQNSKQILKELIQTSVHSEASQIQTK